MAWSHIQSIVCACRETEERPGWCTDPHLPPCAAYVKAWYFLLNTFLTWWLVSVVLLFILSAIRFVEIMAPVFSREAWRCVWHMIQVSIIKYPSIHCSQRKRICRRRGEEDCYPFGFLILYCRMTWSMGGVLILLLGDVWRLVVYFKMCGTNSLMFGSKWSFS